MNISVDIQQAFFIIPLKSVYRHTNLHEKCISELDGNTDKMSRRLVFMTANIVSLFLFWRASKRPTTTHEGRFRSFGETVEKKKYKKEYLAPLFPRARSKGIRVSERLKSRLQRAERRLGYYSLSEK